MKRIFSLFKEAFTRFRQDEAARLAAALAYYTIFSLAPTLIVLLALASIFVDQNHVQAQVVAQTQDIMGEEAATLVAGMVRNPTALRGNWLGAIFGIGALIYGATNVFTQLQSALNTIWRVYKHPRGGLMFMLRQRAFSFVILLLVGLMLLIALVGIAGLSLVDGWLQSRLPAYSMLISLTHAAVLFAVTTLLFALLYKVIPDVTIYWRDVWAGAVVASLLFNLGRWGIGLYIANSSSLDMFGAAGAVAVILIWIYFSAQFFLFGAEFAQVYWLRRQQP